MGSVGLSDARSIARVSSRSLLRAASCGQNTVGNELPGSRVHVNRVCISATARSYPVVCSMRTLV